MSERMGFRKWLAWRLVRLANRLHDPDWLESIIIQSPSGREYRIEILGDEYSHSLSLTTGIHWQVGDGGVSADVEGWTFRWPDAVKWEDARDR